MYIYKQRVKITVNVVRFVVFIKVCIILKPCLSFLPSYHIIVITFSQELCTEYCMSRRLRVV